METILEYLLKSAGTLSIFIIVYHFLLRRLTFFQANRWFLMLGIIASMTFPLIEITQTVYIEEPVKEVYYLSQDIETPMVTVLEQPAVPVGIPFNYWELMMFIYLAVVTFFIGKMIVELSSLFKLIKSGKKIKKEKFVMVALSRKLTPFSFFNYICYSDSEKFNAEFNVILDHEKVHAMQWHSIDVLVSHLYRAVFWINPLTWLLKKQIGENLEFIADAKAKKQIDSSISYERTLLSSAAFHLQPSLANNFFTPFIKKRIMMLQKEASARWNAYKYALILPVIVIFLYSFNVVTEVEYIPKEITSIESLIPPVESNKGKSIAVITDTKPESENLVFDITATTTDQELNEFATAINNYANYKVKFSDQERDENNELERLSISTKFPNKKWDKNMTIGTQPFELLLLEAEKEKLKVNDDTSNEVIYVTEKGVYVEMEDWTYGDMKIEQTEDFGWKKSDSDYTTVILKITPTTTKASLEEHKKMLKENYNVDFTYSKLKYKNGKIKSIKLKLDDHNGIKIEQTYKSNKPISNICIQGVIDGEKRLWKLNNCDDLALSTHHLGGVKYYDLSTAEFEKLSKMSDLHVMSMDSIHKQLKSMNIDSLQNKILVNFRNINMDSLSQQIRLELMNIDSLTNNLEIIHFDDLLMDDDLNMMSTKRKTGTRIDDTNFDKTTPLIIVDGEEMSLEDFRLINGTEKISRYTVFAGEKNNEFIKLYGDKAKHGVYIIDTQEIENNSNLILDAEERRAQILKEREDKRKQLIGRRATLEEKRAMMLQEKDSLRQFKRDELNKRREALREERDEKIAALRSKREAIRNDTSSSNEIENSDTLMNFNRSILETYGNKVKEKGYSFKIKTFKERKGKVTKLKLEFAGSIYTIQPNNDIERLTFNYYKDGRPPTMTSISN